MESPLGTRLIAGRYELQALLGEGGMASVYRARDITLERLVAVKLLFARDERDRQKLVNQFVREAKIAASVQHRNVIHIVDFGTTDNEQPFMVMELLEGETLAERMRREPRLSIAEIVSIAAMTLRGLAAVHAAGIVHRDLKPDNVFLVRDSTGGVYPKILDFGISRSVEPRSGRRSALTTQEGVIVGTPEYMSPEQARGLRTLDKRTDIYSMGVILYEALTGKLPFANEHIGDLIIQIVTASAPRVAELEPRVPLALSDVVARAMARSIEERYADATEMQHALSECTGELGAAIRSLSDLPAPFPAPQVSGTMPRVSVDRLRTLEFPLDEETRAAEPLASKPSAISPKPGAGVPPITVPKPAALKVPAPLGRLPGEPSDTHADDQETLPPARPARSSLVPIVASVVVALAAISAGALMWSKEPAAKPAPASLTHAAPTQAKQRAPLPAPPKPAASVKLELEGVPEGAQILLDGAVVKGPSIELPRDALSHELQVIKDGFLPWHAALVANADQTFRVELAPREKAATRKPATKSPSLAEAKRPAKPARSAPPASSSAQAGKPPSALRKLDF